MGSSAPAIAHHILLMVKAEEMIIRRSRRTILMAYLLPRVNWASAPPAARGRPTTLKTSRVEKHGADTESTSP